MTSERIVLLAILTACMFAVFSYSQSGSFILPLGLYKPGIFISVILLLINERPKLQLIHWVMIGWSLSLLATSIFMHQLVYGETFYQQHEAAITNFNSIAFLLFCLGFFFWQLLVAWKEQSIFRWLQLVNAAMMFTCFLTEQYVWIIVPTLMWITSVFAARTENSLHRSLAGLMGFVIISSWVTGWYFGIFNVLVQM